MWVYVVLIVAGIVLWLNNFGFEIVNFGRDWPLLLVLVGIWGLAENYLRRRGREGEG